VLSLVSCPRLTSKLVLELASGKRFKSIPVKKFLENVEDFIESKYYPDSVEFEWKDAQNMSKDQIISLCNHIRHRQNKYVTDDIFRFHAFYNGKEMVAAEYGREVDVEIAADRAKKQKASRKAAKKKSKTDAPIPQPTMPRPNTVSTSQNEPIPQPTIMLSGNLLPIDPALTADGDHIIDKNQMEKTATDIINSDKRQNSTSLNDNQKGPTTKPKRSRKTDAIDGPSQVITRSKNIQKSKQRK
jgi:hypothetical protein